MVIVRPVGKHNLRRMQFNIGRDHWRYDGEPELVHILRKGGLVERCSAAHPAAETAYHFQFDNIEADVRQHMIEAFSRENGFSKEKAEKVLRWIGLTILQGEIVLEKGEG